MHTLTFCTPAKTPFLSSNSRMTSAFKADRPLHMRAIDRLFSIQCHQDLDMDAAYMMDLESLILK